MNNIGGQPWFAPPNPSNPLFNNWNFGQSCQPLNHDYQCIAKNFLEKYASANLLGIGYIGYYYQPEALCSVHVHQGCTNYLYEIVGHQNFRNKMAELGISMVRYHSIIHTAQPVGKKSVLMTFYGQAEINSKNYVIEGTILIKLASDSPRIANQILNIFMN